MPETRRFLRYVIPGLLSVLEAFLFALFAWPDKAPKALFIFMKELNVSGAFAAFLLTGAIGYFLSVVHHTISWIPCIQRYTIVNYVPFFHKAFKQKLVTKEESIAQDVGKAPGLSIELASQLMAALWNESRECSKQVKAANDRVDSLTDLMHCAGASFVGTWLAYSAFAYVACRRTDANWLWPTVVLAALSYLHVMNYRKLRKDTRQIVEIVFWQELRRREKASVLLLWPENPPKQLWKSKLMFWRKS